MISRELMDHLSARLDCERRRNPLLELAERGALTRDQVAEYIYNTAYFALCTHVHVGLGLFKAENAGLPDLVEFFREKNREEAGHAQWAFQDLRRMELELGTGARLRVQDALIEFMDLVQRELDANPASYLVYSLFAELLNARIAPIFVRALTEHSRLTEEQLSMLVRHAELDRHHVEEDCRFIDQVSTRAGLRLDDCCRYLDALVDHFVRFTCSIARVPHRDAA